MIILKCSGGSLHSVMASAEHSLDISKFEVHSYHYIHFQIITFGKGMNPLSLQL